MIKSEQTGTDVGKKYSNVELNGKTVSIELPSLKKTGLDSWPSKTNVYFDGTTITSDHHKGTMFSIWCDDAYLMTEDQIISDDQTYGALYQLTFLAETYWGTELKSDATGTSAAEPDVETPTEPATEPETLPADTTVDITLTVGGKSEDYTYEWSSEGASDWLYGELVDGYGDKTIAKPSVEVKTETETEIIEAETETYEAETEIVEKISDTSASSLSSGDQIAIGDGTNWLKLNGSTLENTTTKSEATLWTVENSWGSYYTLKSGDKYLYITNSGAGYNKTLSLTVSSSSTRLSYSESKGLYYSYRNSSYYINYSSKWQVSQNTFSYAKAYKYTTETTVTKPAGSTIITPAYTKTTYKSTTIVSFTALKVGTTAFYLKTADGNTVKYNVKVNAEDLSGASTQEIELWITNRYVGKVQSDPKTAVVQTISIDPADANKAEGVLLGDLLTKNDLFYSVDEKGNSVRFWKGVALTESKQVHSGSTGDGDKSDAGNDFAYIRYWGGKWQYLSGDQWLNASSALQVIAYYVQFYEVSPEINNYYRDYGSVAGDGGGEDSSPFSWQYPASGFFGTAVAVVYSDKSMSPKDDDDIWAKTLQLRYSYGAGADPGVILVENTSEYIITKVSIVRGKYYHMVTSSTNATVKEKEYAYNSETAMIWERTGAVEWEKSGISGEEWYVESPLWTREEGDTTESIVLDRNTWGTEWVTKYAQGEAFLILVYVEPVQTETNDLLDIVYKDDTAGTIIRNDIQVSVTAGNTFLNSLNNNGSTTHTAGTIDLKDDAYILNSAGQQQTFNKKLSQVVPNNSTYNSGNYIYVGADISDDGKTLTLHYVKKNTLSVIYWDDTTNTKITTDVVNFYVVQGKNFLNGLKKGDEPISVTAGVRFDLPDGSCIDAFENAGEEDPNKAECIVISKNLTEVNASGIDISLYYYVDADVNESGTTLTIHYKKKNVLKVVYVDDSNGGKEIKTISPFVTVDSGVTFDSSYALDATITVGGKTVNKELNADLLGDSASAYADHYLYKITVEDGGLTLKLYYNKYKTMNVVWVDKATDGTIATDAITDAKADAKWNKDTCTITDNDYVTETDLTKMKDKLTDTKYAEHPYKLVKDDTKVVGDTLYLYYELQTIEVKVVWYDDDGKQQIASASYALNEGKTLVDALSGVTINDSAVTLSAASTLTHNDGSYTIEQDLTKLTLADELAVYQSGIYEYVGADLSDDKMTLTLHYTLKTLTGASLAYVLDYGLPVKVDKIKQTIADAYGIQAYAITLSGETYDGVYASVELSDDSLTYTLTSLMNGAEKVTVNAEVYDVDVTLDIHFIPATNIYYEESFFLNGAQNGGYELSNGGSQLIEWETIGTTSDLFQSADRVGSRNPYGYDDAYATGLGLSAGSALKVTVPFGTKLADCPTLTFDFTGTGFDIISRTGADQGRIGVIIKQGNTVVKEYGVINRGDNELYQVPVMSVEGLEHGTYTVTITVYPPLQMTNRESGAKKFLYGTAQGATFVLDGIRIYDPVDTTDEENSEVLEAYKADGQAVVKRVELRDLLINAGNDMTTNVDKGEGGSEADLNSFTSIGPNNEVYLAPGQSITFTVTLNEGEVLYIRSHAMLGKATGTWTFNPSEDDEFSIPLTWSYGAELTSGASFGRDTYTVTFTNTSTDAISGWIALTDIVITKPASAYND